MDNKMEKKEIDLLEYWRIIMKRKWIIVTFVAVLLALVGIFSFTSTPLYMATASVLIEDPSSSLLNIRDVSNYGEFRYDFLGTYFKTQLKLLGSRSLAERVAKKMNLGARPEFQSPQLRRRSLFQVARHFFSFGWMIPKTKQAPDEKRPIYQPDSYAALASVVLGGLRITPLEETRLVQVSYISSHQVLAADVVNTLVEEFINYSVETRYEATQQASEFLSEQIAQLRDDLAAKEKELQKYGEEKKLLLLNEKESTVVSKFAELDTAFTEAQIERVNKEAILRELRNLDIDSAPQYVNNPLIQNLKTGYTQTKNEYEEKSKIFKPSYPEMIRLRARLDSMKAELESEIKKAVDAAESEYRAALKKESSLRQLLDSQRIDVVKMNNNAILYNSLKIEVENKRSLLNSLVARQNETLVSARLGGLRTSNIKIVDRAMVPGAPFSPNTRRNLIMALLLGLFGGVGLVFFIEYLDNTVKGPEEVEKLTGLASLGIIPHFGLNGLKKRSSYSSEYGYSYGRVNSGKEAALAGIKDIELINHFLPKYSISEDYRTVRTSILFSHAGGAPKTITFTSTLPQEGKTATISNMAIAFAQLGESVLVIDGDLRKHRLHKVFKVRNVVGLSSYLTGKALLEDVIQRTSIENIWLIPSGLHPPNPAELLNSERMRELMQLVKEHFDIVLIDTPPVLAAIDPVIISSFSDCTVFVVRAGKTGRKLFLQAVEEIKKAKSQIIGVIYNEAKIRKNKYYSPYYHYYQKEYYGEYGEQFEKRGQESHRKGQRKTSPS